MIVTFQTTVPDTMREEICSSFRNDHLIKIQSTFRHCLKGFAAQVAQNKLSHISSHPDILRIEPDYRVHTWAQIIPWGVKQVNAPIAALWSGGAHNREKSGRHHKNGGSSRSKRAATPDMRGAQYGVSHRIPSSPSSTPNDGSGIARRPLAGARDRSGHKTKKAKGTSIDCDIFIIDTGISNHPDLNVVEMRNFALGEAWSEADQCGHGTHVAGTAAARDRGAGIVGVAPGARLHGMKALDATGSGQMSWVIAAIDYISETKLRNPARPIVANLSLGFYSGNSSYNALDDAIRPRGIGRDLHCGGW